MERWGKVIAFVASLIVIIAYFSSSINDKIDQKINDPEFVKKVADEVRLPFVIFNDKESVTVDTGAMKYIDKFKIKKDERQGIYEIIISPKSFMAIPPILESIEDKEIEFEEPKRGKKFDLIYKTVQYATGWANTLAEGSNPQRRFRLQLVTLPEQ